MEIIKFLAILDGSCSRPYEDCSWGLLVSGRCDNETAVQFLLIEISLLAIILSIMFGLYCVINKRYYKYFGGALIILIIGFALFAILNTVVNC